MNLIFLGEYNSNYLSIWPDFLCRWGFDAIVEIAEVKNLCFEI